MDNRSLRIGTWRTRDGHGAVTVFEFSKAVFRNCTFVGNRNGVDDLSPYWPLCELVDATGAALVLGEAESDLAGDVVMVLPDLAP